MPTIVIAITTAAISQPSAIHAPPSTIQSTFRSKETGDMAVFSVCRTRCKPEYRAGRIDTNQNRAANRIAADGTAAKVCPGTRHHDDQMTGTYGRSVNASARIRLVSAHAWR